VSGRDVTAPATGGDQAPGGDAEYVFAANGYGRYCIPKNVTHRPAAQAILAGACGSRIRSASWRGRSGPATSSTPAHFSGISCRRCRRRWGLRGLPSVPFMARLGRLGYSVRGAIDGNKILVANRRG
jgi:hypothetical protein